MKPTDLSICLQAFLGEFLPGERNVSENTIKTYGHAFRLLLRYCDEVCDIPPDRLTLAGLTSAQVVRFLDGLEKKRGNGVLTRNLRLAAVHSFCRYLHRKDPGRLAPWQRVMAVAGKRMPSNVEIEHLSPVEMKYLLSRPDLKTRNGLREATLMSLLYDAGLRVQELCRAAIEDVRFDSPSQIKVKGKGRKKRPVPLQEATVQIVRQYCRAYHLDAEERQAGPLFFNVHGNPLTRGGVRYILLKYASKIPDATAGLENVHPHVFRHRRALHLLNADNPMAVVPSFLGHANIVTTCRYAKANMANIRKAKEKAPKVTPAAGDAPAWRRPGIMEWLDQL